MPPAPLKLSSKIRLKSSKIASWRSWAGLGPVLASFFLPFGPSGCRLPGQGAAGCQKDASGVDVGTLLASKNDDLWTLCPCLACFSFRDVFRPMFGTPLL